MNRKLFKVLMDNQQLKKPYLVSRSGEGKSAYVKDYAKDEKQSLFILNMSSIESQDFCGLPYRDENNVTKYARPHFLNHDILFLDEIDRVQDASIIAALISLFIDGKINGHEFTGKIVCAGNAEHDSGTSEFPIALNERIVRQNFAYSAQEKIEYLTGKFGENNKFLKYCSANYKIFDELSTRSIDYYCQIYAADSSAISAVLPAELNRHFENFLANLTMTLDDLITIEPIQLQKRIDALKSITKVSLSLDVAASLEKISYMTKEQVTNINFFINSLETEIKSNYFLQLKTKALKQDSFKDLALKLNDLGFFKEQKEFLKELQK